MPGGTSISVVIPVLDEAGNIAGCIQALAPLIEAGAQIIVADAGSRDGTAAAAAAAGASVIVAPRGRAAQMNAGAAAATGGLLVFVHADTRPGRAACEQLLQFAARGDPDLWGRFDVRLSGRGRVFRLIERCMNMRSRLTGIATGDQMIFVSREAFDAAGRFPEIPLMEDIALSSRLRRRARPCCRREQVEVSSRKWQREGVLRTTALMWGLRLAYALGVDPGRLARLYYRQ